MHARRGMLPGPGGGPLPVTPPPKRALFVCVENANRSQMAEAFARLDGAGRVEAFS